MFGGQIANGTTRTEVKSLYLFNTTHYNWQQNPQTTGQWPEPRDSASGIANIKTGDGYIFGGEPLVTGSNWLFNTTWRLQGGSGWSEIGGSAPGGGRQAHAVVMLSNGQMVILGGADNSGNAIPFTEILIFDTTTGTYTTKVKHDDLYSIVQSYSTFSDMFLVSLRLPECHIVRLKSCTSLSSRCCL